PLPKVKSVPRWRQLVIQLGKGADNAWHDAIDIITFVGRAASWTVNALIHPDCLRPASISRHVAETGIQALPIIGLMAIMIAVVMGLIGGAAIAQSLLDVSPTQYLTRLPQVVDGSDLFVGLFKAPIFAFFIAIISCMHGLRVSGSAESVGRETTRAVVKSIFL